MGSVCPDAQGKPVAAAVFSKNPVYCMEDRDPVPMASRGVEPGNGKNPESVEDGKMGRAEEKNGKG